MGEKIAYKKITWDDLYKLIASHAINLKCHGYDVSGESGYTYIIDDKYSCVSSLFELLTILKQKIEKGIKKTLLLQSVPSNEPSYHFWSDELDISSTELKSKNILIELFIKKFKFECGKSVSRKDIKESYILSLNATKGSEGN